MSGELESFIQQHKAKLAQEKNDLQQVYTTVYRHIEIVTYPDIVQHDSVFSVSNFVRVAVL